MNHRNEDEDDEDEGEEKEEQVPASILVENVVFDNRRIYLYEPITAKVAGVINKKLMVLDGLDKKTPILLEINSPDGCVSSGLSIVNTMKSINAPVITIINGSACSMAAIISVAGTKRMIYQNSWWMAHDMSGGIWGDYADKVEARADWIKKSKDALFDHLKRHTKLTKTDLAKAKHQELWLNPEECYAKGVVDCYIDARGKMVGK